MRSLHLALSALLAGAIPAAAGVEYEAALGQTGQGRCHMDNCEFFVIYRFPQTDSFSTPDDDIKAPADLLRELGAGRR